MKLFNPKVENLSTSQEKTARKIADKILLKQRKMADYLNRKTEMLSPTTWLMLLIAFCAMGGTYCIYLLSQVFN